MVLTFHQLLKTAAERGASEFYFSANTPAQIRIDGEFVALDVPPLDHAEVRQLLSQFIRAEDWAELNHGNPISRGLTLKGVTAFRLTVYLTDDGGMAASVKLTPVEAYGFKELRLPDELGVLPVGLTLIGGPRRSGRSGTLTALLDKINREEHCHITVFSPDTGGFRFQHKSSVVDQVVFTETPVGARRAAEIALWGAADVVAFDDVYGIEGLRTMIHLAQIGCRVIGTVPGRKTTRDVLDASVALVPPFVRPTLQSELGSVLRRVIAQMLLPKANKRGRAVAIEVLDADEATRAAIEKGQLTALDRAVAEGMSLNDSLATLLIANVIDSVTASEASNDLKGFEKAIDQARRRAARKHRESPAPVRARRPA